MWIPANFAGAETRLARRRERFEGSGACVSSARLRLARVQLAQGRYDDALATLDAVAEPSVEPRVLELRGDVKLAQGEKAAALEAWRKAQAAVTTDPEGAGQLDAELSADSRSTN